MVPNEVVGVILATNYCLFLVGKSSKNFVFSAEKYNKFRDRFSARKSLTCCFSFFILCSKFLHILHFEMDGLLMGLTLLPDSSAFVAGLLMPFMSSFSDEFESSFCSIISTEFESAIFFIISAEFESAMGLITSAEFESAMSFINSAEFESAINFVGSVLIFLSVLNRVFPLFR